MTKLILTLFIGYVLYRFVMRILLPVLKVTVHTSRQMRKMQEHMNKAQQQTPQPRPQAKKQTPVEGSYIDFEEIK